MGLFDNLFNKEQSVVQATTNTTPEQTYNCENVNVFDLKDVTKVFKTDKGDFTLFDKLNLTIPDFVNSGQFISIMGQSGSGKSQLLQLMSGLSKPTSGDIFMYGKKLKSNFYVPTVFQQYSSFPWLNIIDNVALPLKMQGVGEKERYEKAKRLLEIVGLNGQEDKWPSELSGGQQQRVAIARSLICGNQIIFMDEATSALDIKMKRELQDTVLDVFYKSEFDPTFVSVTHNIDEAVYLSNRIIILQANPCRIHKVIDIDFGKQRSHEIRQSQKYLDYVREIENIMNQIN